MSETVQSQLLKAHAKSMNKVATTPEPKTMLSRILLILMAMGIRRGITNTN